MTTTTGVPAKDGVHPGIEESAYHADRGSLSVSGAKLLLPPSCPALFRERMDNPPPPKREFDFGHVAHRLVLGKGAEFAVLDPAIHGLTKDGTVSKSPRATASWKAAEQEARAAGLVPIHIDDYNKAKAMAAKVNAHPIAGPLFAEGDAEVSLYHTDPATGVRLRGRCDWIDPAGDIDDYKTSITANPAELERRFYTLAYFQQAAWYIDLAIALGVSENPDFTFVVQDKKPPHLVTVVRYDDEAIAEGRRLNRQAIETYARCVESGVWPGYTDQIVTLSLPRWAMNDSIQTDADALIAELEGMTA